MRRTAILILVLVLLAAAGIFWLRQRQMAQAAPFEILREATVARGRITATVSAAGAIEPEALVSLSFGMSGTVQRVNVMRGQRVDAGDILATLNTQELELALKQAEDALRIQELTRRQRLNSQPSPATLASAQADIDAAQANVSVAEANVASAEAAVLQAQAQRAQLLAGSTAGQLAAAEAQVASARLQQRNALEAHNRTLECFSPPGGGEQVCPGLGAPEEQARANLENANAALEAAEAQLADLRAGPRAGDIQAVDAAIASARAGVLAAQGNLAAAQANLARAQAAYQRLLEPASEDEIAVLDAQVASVETNLALARLRLEQSRIVAPIAGNVANVLINEGELATPGAPAVTIVDEGAFHINVNVDEIDIDQVVVGQPVDITLDALVDVTVTGTVAEIAPTPVTSAGGVVSYLVTINLGRRDDLGLRPGMSANASIVVEEIDDVLIVPNWSVRLDRDTGRAYVNVKRSDVAVEEVAVQTGLRNEQFSEVISGLRENDVVVVTNQRDVFNLFGN